MVFMYLGVGIKVAFPLKQGFSTSPRGGISVDRIPNFSCGGCPVGVLETSCSGISPHRDLGNKSHMGQVLGKPMFETLRNAYAASMRSHFFSEEVPSWLADAVWRESFPGALLITNWLFIQLMHSPQPFSFISVIYCWTLWYSNGLNLFISPCSMPLYNLLPHSLWGWLCDLFWPLEQVADVMQAETWKLLTHWDLLSFTVYRNL